VKVLGRPGFSFVGEWRSETGAVVEFDGEIDGIRINGVDMITVGDDGRITHFKVMVRPLKALNLLHRLMGGNWDIELELPLGLQDETRRPGTKSEPTSETKNLADRQLEQFEPKISAVQNPNNSARGADRLYGLVGMLWVCCRVRAR